MLTTYASEWGSPFPPPVAVYCPGHKEHTALGKSSWDPEEAHNAKPTFATCSSSPGARMLYKANQLQAARVGE